ASTLSVLSKVYRFQGRLDEAERTHAEAMELMQQMLGTTDPAALADYEELTLAHDMEHNQATEDFLNMDRGYVANVIGRFLATDGSAMFRDGKRAVTYANEAVKATARRDADCLDTLAAALAEAGDFTNAVAVQKEAVARLQDAKRKDAFEARLNQF